MEIYSIFPKIENLKKRIKVQKLIIEEQKTIAESAQQSADKEYGKLKQLENILLILIDELTELENRRKNND